MAHDKERYRRACTLIEFMTQIAGAMEVAGELRESLSDRIDELIELDTQGSRVVAVRRQLYDQGLSFA